nr:MAG TPA: hypothetical protein [Caudoviricetes sp.]
MSDLALQDRVNIFSDPVKFVHRLMGPIISTYLS